MNFDSSKCIICESVLPKDRASLFCEKCEPEVYVPREIIKAESKAMVKKEVVAPLEYLPNDLLEDVVSALREGEIGYTVPWAMFANEDRRLYIVGSYTVFHQPGGTVCMRIMKKNGEIWVDKSTLGDYRYSPGEPHYVGVTPEDYIPVKLVNRL